MKLPRYRHHPRALEQQDVAKLKKIDEAELQLLKKRINWVYFMILGFALVLVARLWFLQILHGSDYLQLSEKNRIRLQGITAPRGNILDRKGRVIVANRPFFNVALVREDATNLESTLKKTAHILDEDLGSLWDRVREGEDYPRYLPIRLQKDIDWKHLVKLENHRYDLPGIRIEVVPSRTYEYTNLASHLLGYLGSIGQEDFQRLRSQGYQRNDLIGQMGVEKLYEKTLRGEPGRRIVEVDVAGFEQREIEVQDPQPGADLQLTIDIDLQKTAEEALAGKAGSLVVLEVHTGRVLAMASSPPLELEKFIGGISAKNWDAMMKDPLKPMTNKAIQGVYPPGSTYKIMTAIAGLNEKIATPDTTYFCGGAIQVYGQTRHCWKKEGHGTVNLRRALAESCDVYFYQVGMKLGVDRLAKYATSFGLGSKTGIEIENEAAGLIPTSEWKLRKKKEKWQEGENLSIAIGQGFNLTTPLQVCQMTATLSNGGTRYRPQLIESVNDTDGRRIKSFEPMIDGHAVATKDSILNVLDGLVAAVNDDRGTGKTLRTKSVIFGGKTGTVQVVHLDRTKHLKEEQIPYKYRDHAWFTCFAPADNPVIAVTAMVEHGLHGASGAGPVAQKVLEAYFQPHPDPGSVHAQN